MTFTIAVVDNIDEISAIDELELPLISATLDVDRENEQCRAQIVPAERMTQK